MGVVATLVEEDFGITGFGRWLRSEKHSSLVVDDERDIFFFNAEGIVGDALIYLTKVRGVSFQDAREYLRKFGKTYSGYYVHRVDNEKGDVIVYPKLVEIFWENGKASGCRDYLYKRGITDASIDRFQLGYYNGFSTVPFFESGTFRNFQMRRDTPTKMFFSYYKLGNPLLFNSDVLRFTNEVFFVEGPIDAIAMEQNGIHAVSTNASGLVIPEWYGKFIRQKTIYILFDNDRGGREEAVRAAEMLGEDRCKLYCFQDFEQEKYDPVDFFRDGHSPDELKKLVESNAKYLYQLDWRKPKYDRNKTNRYSNSAH